eukprot:405988-Karenia_brevis.AAC.1
MCAQDPLLGALAVQTGVPSAPTFQIQQFGYHPGMATDGGSGPPNSPLSSEHGDDGSQCGFQHGSGAGDSAEG